MNRVTLMLLLLAGVSNSAIAAHWVEYHDVGKYVMYADIDSTQRTGGTVKIRTKMNTDSGNDNVQYEIDCRNEMIRIASLSVMGFVKVGDKPGEKIVKDSQGWKLFKLSCN